MDVKESSVITEDETSDAEPRESTSYYNLRRAGPVDDLCDNRPVEKKKKPFSITEEERQVRVKRLRDGLDRRHARRAEVSNIRKHVRKLRQEKRDQNKMNLSAHLDETIHSVAESAEQNVNEIAANYFPNLIESSVENVSTILTSNSEIRENLDVAIRKQESEQPFESPQIQPKAKPIERVATPSRPRESNQNVVPNVVPVPPSRPFIRILRPSTSYRPILTTLRVEPGPRVQVQAPTPRVQAKEPIYIELDDDVASSTDESPVPSVETVEITEKNLDNENKDEVTNEKKINNVRADTPVVHTISDDEVEEPQKPDENDKISELISEVSSLQSTIEAKDRIIQTLRASNLEKDEVIATLRALIVDQEFEICNLKTERSMNS